MSSSKLSLDKPSPGHGGVIQSTCISTRIFGFGSTTRSLIMTNMAMPFWLASVWSYTTFKSLELSTPFFSDPSIMAPKSKRPKVGLRRMDAALDAMGRLGFSDHVVRISVRDLLKVYGEEGWIFIEEAAYKLLIETILDKQVESDDHEHDQADQAQPPKQIAAEISSSIGTSPNFQENIPEPFDKEDSTLNSAPPKVAVRSKQVRKPCYGWISDDSDEDGKDLVLPHAAKCVNK